MPIHEASRRAGGRKRNDYNYHYLAIAAAIGRLDCRTAIVSGSDAEKRPLESRATNAGLVERFDCLRQTEDRFMWRRNRLGGCSKQARRPPRRRLSFEQFEPRQMMAVTTSLNNGALSVIGDASDDVVEIVGTAQPGELTITGRNGTSVNGVTDGRLTISGVRGGLLVNTGAGNDALALANTFIAGSIFLLTGDGDDRITLGTHGVVSPAGDLDIETGAGNDQVYELNYSVYVVGSNLVNLGTGFDNATLVGVSATGGHYGTAFPLSNTKPGIEVSASDGQDNMLAVGLSASGVIEMNGVGGSSIALLNSSADAIDVFNAGGTTFLDTNYTAAAISIYSSGLAGGPDTSIVVNHCLCAGVYMNVGRSNNFVRLYGNAMTGSYASRAGEPGTVLAGIYIFAARARSSEAPYQNRNTFEVTYNVAVRGAIHLGDGDDSLELIGNLTTATRSPLDSFAGFNLDGFGGFNRIVEQGNTITILTRQNFAS